MRRLEINAFWGYTAMKSYNKEANEEKALIEAHVTNHNA